MTSPEFQHWLRSLLEMLHEHDEQLLELTEFDPRVEALKMAITKLEPTPETK